MRAFKLLVLFIMLSAAYGFAGVITLDSIRAEFHPGTGTDSTVLKTAQDSWFSRDKGLHLTGSIILTAGLSKCLERFGENRLHQARRKGMTVTFVLGLSKEFRDGCQVRNRFSYKDLAYDILGTVIGGLIVSID